MPARFSRRSFLAGAVGTAFVSAGCGRRSRARSAGHVVVANHPLYIDASTNRTFTDETGISVEYHEEIVDDDAWFASVRPRLARGESLDRDVLVVRDDVASLLDANGWLTDVPRVTWALGMVGVAYDSRVTTVTHFVDLFHDELHGSVALPLDLRQSLGIALLTDGVDPSTVTYDDAAATAGRLANSVRIGQVALVDDPIGVLASGHASAAVVRAGDCVGADQHIGFLIPSEGGLEVRDVAVVPVGGGNRDGARKYLQFVSAAAHSAERFRVVPAMWEPDPLLEAILQRDAPAVLADQRRNPPASTRTRLRTFRALDEHELPEFHALFDSVVHAAD